MPKLANRRRENWFGYVSLTCTNKSVEMWTTDRRQSVYISCVYTLYVPVYACAGALSFMHLRFFCLSVFNSACTIITTAATVTASFVRLLSEYTLLSCIIWDAVAALSRVCHWSCVYRRPTVQCVFMFRMYIAVCLSMICVDLLLRWGLDE